jgi:hypothetical protein
MAVTAEIVVTKIFEAFASSMNGVTTGITTAEGIVHSTK